MKVLDKVHKRGKSPTPKQRKLASLVADNLGHNKETKTMGQLMKQVGYSEVQTRQPQQITRSQGFLVALDELGLTDNFVVSSLVEDIRAKPQRRAFELSIAAKIRGLDRRADENMGSSVQIANSIIVINAPNGSTEPLLDHK